MAKAKRLKTLDVPPFPPLKWREFFWVGLDVLPSWAGFQERQRPYASRSSRKPSTGRVEVTVSAPGGDDDDDDDDDDSGAPLPGPSPAQVRAYRFLKENEAAVAAAVRNEIVKGYPDLVDGYDYDEEEAAELMPPVRGPDDLRKLIGLGSVHVHPVEKSGVAYIGFEFGCTWDDEHGLGVMTHKKRVIQIGGADTSILEWIAERDARRKPSRKPKPTAKRPQKSKKKPKT